jgi:hypothetical protein
MVVISVFVLCIAASAAPQGDDGFVLPETLQGRARVVAVKTAGAPDPGVKARGGLAEWEAPVHPTNMVVEVINDETVARGARSTDPGPEAVVFSQMLDSGFCWFLDNTPGTVQWHRMIMGNGFVPGGALSSFAARVYVSPRNYGAFDGTASFTMELWDGDPLAIQDTTCSTSGFPAVIPGTTCTFTDLPEGIAYDLKCVFPAAVPINCDRVFGVVWPGDVCRWSWRLSEGFTTGGSSNGPLVGAGDAMGMVWACEQFISCATGSGYNAGYCCDDQSGDPGMVACDHTDANENNWIPAGGGCNPGLGTHEMFCSDGGADYFTTYQDEAPVYYNNFVGAAYAPTDVYVSLQPVSADAPPESNPPHDGWGIVGNEIFLAEPGRPVWLEVRISDWDPDQTGRTLKSYEAFVDPASYSSGGGGAVEAFGVPCVSNADCEAALGVGSACNLEPWPGHCAPIFLDDTRPDFVFQGVAWMGGANLCVDDLPCYGSLALWDPITSPGHETYVGTLVLSVPPDAAGTSTIELIPVWTRMSESHDPQVPIPMVGTVPAKITIETAVIAPKMERSRYLSFTSLTAGRETALRVTFTSLPAPYDAWNGGQMWVGPPTEYCENAGQNLPPPGGCGPAAGEAPTFMASTLQCEPYYMDWSALDAVHVFHEGVVSRGTYDIQSLDLGNDPSVEDHYTFPVQITTSRWGDVVSNCATYPCGPPDGSVDITTDVTALLDKYRNALGAPVQVRADLVDYAGGVAPDQKTTIRDIVVAIDAFLGIGYPFAPGPPPCAP